MNMLPIELVLRVMDLAIVAGCKFLSQIGIGFLIIFIAVEFIKAGIEATSGRGFSVDKVLYLYLFMAVFYAAYPTLQAVLKDYAFSACRYIYSEFGVLNMSIEPSIKIFNHVWDNLNTSPFVAVITASLRILGCIIVYAISFVIALITMIVVDIVVLGAFFSFEVLLAAGPFFIPFFMSSNMSHLRKQWVNNLLMYCLQFPIIAMVLQLIKTLNYQVAFKLFVQNVIGKSQVSYFYTVLFIPLLGLGLLWQALNITKMLFPPSGGFVGTSIGAPVMAAATYTAHTVTKVATKAAMKAAVG